MNWLWGLKLTLTGLTDWLGSQGRYYYDPIVRAFWLQSVVTVELGTADQESTSVGLSLHTVHKKSLSHMSPVFGNVSKDALAQIPFLPTGPVGKFLYIGPI